METEKFIYTADVAPAMPNHIIVTQWDRMLANDVVLVRINVADYTDDATAWRVASRIAEYLNQVPHSEIFTGQ